ncbi:MAG: hypothetical protein AB7O87_10740 [Candidatus Nitrosocosmicus sp.]
MDPNTVISDVPTGNVTLDFNDPTRALPNLYTNSFLAADVKTG